MEYIGSEKHLNNLKKARLIGFKKLSENKKKRIVKYLINPKKCMSCEGSLSYKNKYNKFCNSSCAAKYNNKNRKLSNETKNKISKKLKNRKLSENHINKLCGKNNSNWKGGIYSKSKLEIRKCKLCNNKFIPQIISNNKISRSKFCSDNCRNTFQSKNMKIMVLNGTHKGWNSRNIISYPEQFFIKVLNNNNIKYKHNYPVNKKDLGLNESYNYFLDFYFKNKKIDLEIDGKQHERRKKHDEIRDELLKNYGIKVYRIKWKNVNTKNGAIYIKNEINKFLEFYNTTRCLKH